MGILSWKELSEISEVLHTLLSGYIREAFLVVITWHQLWRVLLLLYDMKWEAIYDWWMTYLLRVHLTAFLKLFLIFSSFNVLSAHLSTILVINSRCYDCFYLRLMSHFSIFGTFIAIWRNQSHFTSKTIFLSHRKKNIFRLISTQHRWLLTVANATKAANEFYIWAVSVEQQYEDSESLSLGVILTLA